jgi:hypothetical protein
MSEPRYATLGIGRLSYDVVEIVADGKTIELTESQARDYHAKLPAPKPGYAPTPPFDPWWKYQEKKRYRVWVAELITAAGTTPVDIGDAVRGRWGFPVQAAMRLLEQLGNEGWRLVHVSEDHGLYNGADARDEAYLARVRYLLSR